MVGTTGQAEIKTKYPVVEGLASDEKHDGQENNLVAEVDLTEHWGSI